MICPELGRLHGKKLIPGNKNLTGKPPWLITSRQTVPDTSSMLGWNT